MRTKRVSWLSTSTFTRLLKSRTYALMPRPGASPSGRFAIAPIRKLDMEEIAAVERMRSLRTLPTQTLYAGSDTHKSFCEQMQGPPDCDSNSAFREICHILGSEN